MSELIINPPPITTYLTQKIFGVTDLVMNINDRRTTVKDTFPYEELG